MVSQLEHRIDFSKLLLGDAIFTLRSKKTGSHFTYRLEKKSNILYFLSVMCSPDNTAQFGYLGVYRPDKKSTDFSGLCFGLKSRISAFSKQWLAIKYLFDHPETDLIEIFHEGRCMKCGKRLTTPRSIEIGIGPKCEKGI